jgi:hypothetical protein
MNKEFNYQPLYVECKNGKEHSLRYDEHEPKFAKYLRKKYYNVMLSNRDVSIIKKDY